jgi:protein gp37
MGKETNIAWTDHTFNPWWGCVKVSPACEHCYAETFSKRVGQSVWGPTAPRRFFKDKHWNEPLKWDEAAAAAGKKARVFCSSMADVCEDRPDLVAPRQRLMELIGKTPNLDWLLLTKRPENFIRLFPWNWPDNVWAMTTVEDQTWADRRLPELLKVPAKIIGVSYEPALGHIDFTLWYHKNIPGFYPKRGLDWVIFGGESGAGCRPPDLAWARSTRDQAKANDIAFFMKQIGGNPNKKDQLDDFPDDLRIREFPLCK